MKVKAHLLALDGLAIGSDAALWLARVTTGAFLVHGVWDNMVEPARMSEFATFMRASGFVVPELLAPFSVYTQLIAGLLLILGLLTRWAGLVVTATFVVALWVVHWEQTFREWWPALALVVLGTLFLTVGGGRYAVDRLILRVERDPAS
jgi:putative oxidoreductase